MRPSPIRLTSGKNSARAAYNMVVEEEARTAQTETKFDAFKRLTGWRRLGIVGNGPAVLHRGAVLQALTSCRKHREEEAKRHWRAMLDLQKEGVAATWIHDLPDGLFPPDGRKECREWLDALPDSLKPSREIRSAVLHTSKRNPPTPRPDRSRMRRRKEYELGKHRPSLFFVDQLKKINSHHMRLPGRVVIKVKGAIPENFTSVQIVERTIHPQGRKGKPCPNSKRRFSLHVQYRETNPWPKSLINASGIDLGVVNAAGTSNGNLFCFTDNESDFDAIAESQRRASKQRAGSVSWRKEKRLQNRKWRKIKGFRGNESKHLALHLGRIGGPFGSGGP